MPVTVVNMIPNFLSGEIQRDSEPNVSVNPANPLQIAASAFTPDPANSGSGPIFVSTDGGNTWALNVVLPGGNRTGDVSLRFASTSSVLYAGILRSDIALQLNILRSANFTAPGLMTTLVNRANDDQPWVEAATAMGGAGAGADRLYVSSNDISQRTVTGRTATVEQSLDAATAAAPAGIAAARLEVRATAALGGGSGSQDGPSARMAVHPDGTVYGAYLGWRTFATPNITDVVVVRDDDWGAGATPYRDLIDAGDVQAGVRVVSGVSTAALNTTLGTQRIGSQIAIAVDPRNSSTVYVAWADGGTAATYTVRLRRSIDRGQTWSADLRSIVPATNPCVAIDVHGRVGFMYQQLANPGTGNRWRTHLEISNDGFATAPTDLTLADVPDANGTYAGNNPIGDYANLTAVGKSFYGVFSANNTPDNANFPNGVTYQRNANFVTHTLLANDGVTAVGVSIDPFFFRQSDIGAGDDFYVRDWTDSAASGDTGLEPSTHPVFYATSDVWNRRGTLPGPFPNDQPSNEDAGNGAAAIGDNWAFARVRRNAAGTGSTTVTAHFLVSKLGTGSNYVDAGSMDPDVAFPAAAPTLTFNAADLGPLTTPAYPWHLAAVSSTHLCLAVEISTPGDPFVAPSLLGRAPGWPTTDLAVINDNNKAQRNMGLSTTAARGAGLSDELFAWVHNAATFRRDIVIRFHAAASTLRRLAGARVHVAGGKEQAFEPGRSVTLPDLSPGENRWVRVLFKPPRGKAGEVLALYFDEVVGGKAVNGFGIGVRIGTDAQVARAVLERHRSVFTRLAALKGPEGAREQVELAAQALRSRSLDLDRLCAFLAAQDAAIGALVDAHLHAHDAADPFEIAKAARLLAGLSKKQHGADVAVAHTRLLERLDTFLTALELAQGDPADIVQNLRWQAELYRRLPRLRRLECATEMVTHAQDFVAACGERRTGLRGYPKLMKSLLPCFAQTAEDLGGKALAALVDTMRGRLDDLAGLQKAHREFLLTIDGRGRPARPIVVPRPTRPLRLRSGDGGTA